MKKSSASSILSMAVAMVLLMGAGCATTKQARKTETSGFLGNYAELRPGEEGEALLLYRNPAAELGRYDKIMFEPVRAYAAQDSSLGDLKKEELQHVLNYFDAAVREKLGPQYEFVTSPGPGTMRLRIALTEAKGSKVVLDTLSSVTPPGIIINVVKNLATGVPTSVGSARVEVEILDSETDDRLLAAVDERVGGKAFEGKFEKWDDVLKSIDHWAGRMQTRLAEERAKP